MSKSPADDEPMQALCVMWTMTDWSDDLPWQPWLVLCTSLVVLWAVAVGCAVALFHSAT